MSLNLINPTKQAISCNYAVMAYDFLAAGNTHALHQMGLDDAAIECLIKMENVNIRLVVLAFEQALTIQTYVDPSIIKQVLINNTNKNKDDALLKEFIIAGAPFEMIKFFFKTHTNRKHTELRQEFKVSNYELKYNNKVSQKAADEFFSMFVFENKEINALDVMNFAKIKHYSMASIWKEYQVFMKNGAA